LGVTVPALEVHVTPVFVAFATDAVNCAVAPAFTVVVVGVTVTLTGGGGGGSVPESPPQATALESVINDSSVIVNVRRLNER
jgi:metallophosphoesterase superfamily enzyme